MKRRSAKYFLKKFEAIPKHKWAIGEFANKNGQMCALGHCGEKAESSYSIGHGTNDSRELTRIFNDERVGASVADFNDGTYQQFRGQKSRFYALDMPVTDIGTSAKERMVNILTLIASGVWKEFRESLDEDNV